jgi:hypothetical protein
MRSLDLITARRVPAIYHRDNLENMIVGGALLVVSTTAPKAPPVRHSTLAFHRDSRSGSQAMVGPKHILYQRKLPSNEKTNRTALLIWIELKCSTFQGALSQKRLGEPLHVVK